MPVFDEKCFIPKEPSPNPSWFVRKINEKLFSRAQRETFLTVKKR